MSLIQLILLVALFLCLISCELIEKKWNWKLHPMLKDL